MVNIRIIASYRKIITLKNYVKGNKSSVNCFGTGIINGKDRIVSESCTTVSDHIGNYYLNGHSRANSISTEASFNEKSFQRITLPKKNLGCCRYSDRFYSNEKNLLVNDNKTGGNEWGGPEAERLVVKLEENILESMKTYESLLVYFYTLWCKHCKKLKPVYGAAAVKMKEGNVPGHLAAVDLTKRMDIADKFNIVSVPIMYYFRKGEFMKVYDGKRTTEDIINFMKNPPDKPSVPSKIDI